MTDDQKSCKKDIFFLYMNFSTSSSTSFATWLPVSMWLISCQKKIDRVFTWMGTYSDHSNIPHWLDPKALTQPAV